MLKKTVTVFYVDLAADPIFSYLSQFAYQPTMVYIAVFVMMIASGFGFPLPEEVTIISVGILAYMGANPDVFPPPYPGAPVVNGIEAAVVTTLSIFIADNLVFWIGRTFGRKLMKARGFSRFFEGPVMTKVNAIVTKYGKFAAFIFRFTPGIRFPAHLFMGMSNFSAPMFALVDGFAVLISVPTQVLLLYHFGEPILKTLSTVKFYLLGALVIAGVYFLIRKYTRRSQQKQA
jgi:membrane protein DedA with SNARE-associated domain